MITQAEQEAIARIKESLTEFPDNRMAQQIFSEDLQLLVKMIEKCAKK